MGYYVFFQISWASGTPDKVVSIAEKHYRELSYEWERVGWKLEDKRNIGERVTLPRKQPSKEAIWFLNDIYHCRGYREGPKGDSWSWSIVGNYLNASQVIEDLIPFFRELYRKKVLLDFERVIAFCEDEQSRNVKIYQLSWDNDEIRIDNFESEGEWFWGVY